MISYPIIQRDPVLESEYAAAKAERSIADLSDIAKWPGGLQERFSRRLDLTKKELDVKIGLLFTYSLTSSWVSGAGVDEFTEFEEPDFWELKKAKKTWNGRFPKQMKFSDYDFNIYSAYSGQPIEVTALWDIFDNDTIVRIDIYPTKGEPAIRLR